MDMVLFVGWTARTVIWLTDDTALAQSLSNSRAESHWVSWRLHDLEARMRLGNRQVAHLAGN
jgi:hypothetical protein